MFQLFRKFALCLTLGLLAPTMAIAQAPSASSLAADRKAELARFLEWFGGEWDNFEQVWQRKTDNETRAAAQPPLPELAPIANSHHILVPVAAPKVGGQLFYMQQSLGADLSKVYRQRLYRVTPDASSQAIKLETFSLPDEKSFVDAHLKPALFAQLDPASLRAIPGCEQYWRYQASAKEYIGSMLPGACSKAAAEAGSLATDLVKLGEKELWISEQARNQQGSQSGTTIRTRKVRYYLGWMFGKDSDGRRLQGRRDLQLHNEGQIVTLNFEDGSPSKLQIQLAQLTYQNTRAAILKLTLLDQSTGKTIAYTWSDPESNTIGMNLGWIQFGFKPKTSDLSFGFASKPD